MFAYRPWPMSKFGPEIKLTHTISCNLCKKTIKPRNLGRIETEFPNWAFIVDIKTGAALIVTIRCPKCNAKFYEEATTKALLSKGSLERAANGYYQLHPEDWAKDIAGEYQMDPNDKVVRQLLGLAMRCSNYQYPRATKLIQDTLTLP